MQQTKENDVETSNPILKVFGINERHHFYFPKGVNAGTILIDDSMLWGLCTLLQQIVPPNVEICLPCMHQVLEPNKTNQLQVDNFKRQTSERLQQLRHLLTKKVVEQKQETDTILIPLNTNNGHWQLMVLRLQPDKQSYAAEIINSINIFYQDIEAVDMIVDGRRIVQAAEIRQHTSAEIVRALYLDFAGEVQSVLGRITAVTYKQSILQGSDLSCGFVLFMNMLWELNLLDPLVAYPNQLEQQCGGRAGEYGGLLLTRSSDLHWRAQVLGLLLIKYPEIPGLITQRLINAFQFDMVDACDLAETHQFALNNSFFDGGEIPVLINRCDPNLLRPQLSSRGLDSSLSSGGVNVFQRDTDIQSLRDKISAAKLQRQTGPRHTGLVARTLAVFGESVQDRVADSNDHKAVGLDILLDVINKTRTVSEFDPYRPILNKGRLKPLLDEYDRLFPSNGLTSEKKM